MMFPKAGGFGSPPFFICPMTSPLAGDTLNFSIFSFYLDYGCEIFSFLTFS
jgi:hypothetical protein